MFKKFKDKLAEEMKQSPSRLQAGMQQLAQAVISPAASNNLIGDITTSVEDLNLTSEEAEILRNNSSASQFQSVDLQAPNSMERSRRSSFSSVTSDNFFPSYESPGSLYHLQSDMEQSASEFEDNAGSQLDHVSKEELYNSYRKLRTKYTKYRAVYRELYKDNMKMKSVLVETQDKALRRIANLKEQCQLEQEAKAHLEEALRNDIEEKDHLIDTLTTKIKLLQSNESSNDSTSSDKAEAGIADSSTIANNDNIISENANLKEKVKRFETLLAKCNESLKRNKEKISQLTEERDILERDLNQMKSNNDDRTEMLESEVYKAKREVLSLTEKIDVLKKREEDSALSLAENKLFIHRELDVKEEQNKKLEKELKKVTDYKDILAEAVVKYDQEFKQIEAFVNDKKTTTTTTTNDYDKMFSKLRDIVAEKSDAVKLIQQEIKEKIIGTEDESRSTGESSKVKKEASVLNDDGDNENFDKSEEQMNKSRDELEIQNAQILGLKTELKSSKSTINDLKDMLKEVAMDWEQVKKEKECLIANILEYKRVIGILKGDCNSLRNEFIKNVKDQEEYFNERAIKVLNLAIKRDEEGETHDNIDDSGIELKTIINDNNELRKRCEELIEDRELMFKRVNELESVDKKNVKLIAEIDELNFKLRDLNELKETQDKLQSDMDNIRERFPIDNNAQTILFNNETLNNDVSYLKEKISRYDELGKENASLKEEIVEKSKELSMVREELSKNIQLGVKNFSSKCTEYETAIENLTKKFNEQTKQLEKLNDELVKQKISFSELGEKYNSRNEEFKEANEAFVKQTNELKELDEKYVNQCNEIEKLRIRETEILEQLDETVKVRQEMLTKVGELDNSRSQEIEELKFMNEEVKSKLESSKKVNGELETEIGDLKNVNEELNLKIRGLESSNEELLGNNKGLKEELNEILKLNSELKEAHGILNGENTRLKEAVESLGEKLEEDRNELEKVKIEIKHYENRNKKLEQKINGFESCEEFLRTKNGDLLEQMNDLKKEIGDLDRLNIELSNKNTDLVTEFEELRASFVKKESELSILKSKNNDLETENTDRVKKFEEKLLAIADLEKMVDDLSKEIDLLRVSNKNLEDESNKKSIEIIELEKEIKDLRNKIEENREEVDNLILRLSKSEAERLTIFDDKSKLEKLSKDLENESISLKEEIEKLEIVNNELKLLTEERKGEEDLGKENSELRTRLDEALILYEGKESQINILNQEMKIQNEKLEDKLKINEEEQSMRIKQLVKEFQAQIQDKDEQIQAALEKRFERQQNYESELIQQYKEQLKDFQIELTAKSEQIENLILENKETIQSYKNQINELTETISQVKKEHVIEFQEAEQNWKSILKQRTDQLENKHVDEVNELTKEWWNERKDVINSDTSTPGELESTSRVAMATIQSNTGSLQTLQQTCISQKRELSELRKLLRIRNDSLEGSTEIEYLRNILFEYMMGKETLVLSKVISAVVKFDQEQTTKVLKKEEDKLTLLGSLGLL